MFFQCKSPSLFLYPLFVLFFVQSAAAAGARPCVQDVFCVVLQGKPGGYYLAVQNKAAAEITINLDFESEVFTARIPTPVTATVLPRKTIRLISLKGRAAGTITDFSLSYSWQWGSRSAKHDANAVYLLPYEKGKRYSVLQGYNGSFSHAGVHALDFRMPFGTKIHAARDGVVIATRERFRRRGPQRFAKYNNFVYIRHADGTIAKYVHLRQNGVEVNPGDTVRAGDFLAYSGNTGFSSTPHLHFEVGKPLDGSRWSTIPTVFLTARHGVTQLKQGSSYTAVHSPVQR